MIVREPVALAKVQDALTAGNAWAKKAPILIAVEERLMGHPMAGFSAPKVREALHIPQEYRVICMISLGYPGDMSTLDERTRARDARPRARKPISEIVFHDGWQDQK